MRFVFILSSLFLYPFFLNAQALGFSLAHGKKKVKIPIEVLNNLVVIPVTLNGQIPLKFILDTGVRTAILTDKEFSDFLNLTYSKKFVFLGLGGEHLVDAYITNDVSLPLPGVDSKGHAMLVLDQDFLQLKNYIGTGVYGILGYELFSRFIVKIDYQKKQLWLITPEKFHQRRKYQALPIQVQDTKPYIYADVNINDSTTLRAKLLIDSGASHGLILEPESDSSIHIPNPNISSIIGRGLAGVIYGKIARIKSLKLGKYQIDGVVTNFPDANSYVDTLKVNPAIFRNGAIGGEVLTRFNVIFNFPEEKIYLSKNRNFKRSFYCNLSGLTIKATGEQLNKFEITNIRENSPSKNAGLLIGDIVTRVNGFYTNTLELNQINNFFNSAPRKRIVMEIERGGESLKKEFRLENPI